jgi:hypothetical protein
LPQHRTDQRGEPVGYVEQSLDARVALQVRREVHAEVEADDRVGDLAWRKQLEQRVVAAVGDVLAGLVYLAFVAAVAPIEGYEVLVRYKVEDVFDVVAIGALLVAALELAILLVIHRVANYLEPWPPEGAGAAA